MDQLPTLFSSAPLCLCGEVFGGLISCDLCALLRPKSPWFVASDCGFHAGRHVLSLPNGGPALRAVVRSLASDVRLWAPRGNGFASGTLNIMLQSVADESCYSDFVQAASITSELTELARRAGEAAQAESVLVFGSLARGEAREDSDIDLALVVPEQTDARAALRAAIGATMHRLVPLDLVVLHWSTAANQRTMLAREVRRDGILLYGKPI